MLGQNHFVEHVSSLIFTQFSFARPHTKMVNKMLDSYIFTDQGSSTLLVPFVCFCFVFFLWGQGGGFFNLFDRSKTPPKQTLIWHTSKIEPVHMA